MAGMTEKSQQILHFFEVASVAWRQAPKDLNRYQ